MKKTLYIVTILSVLLLSACEMEKETENVSKLTTFPELKVTGDLVDVILVGDAYTDPGAKAFEGPKEVALTTTGSVDPTTPGVYLINYSTKNNDGFTAEVTRIVGVITAEAAADDLTGSYQRDAGRKGISEWTKVKNGLYKCTDVGGALLEAQYVYVFNIKKDIIVVPPQPLGGSGSEVECTYGDGSTEIPFTQGPVGTVSYKWVVVNSGYLNNVRNFVKQ